MNIPGQTPLHVQICRAYPWVRIKRILEHRNHRCNQNRYILRRLRCTTLFRCRVTLACKTLSRILRSSRLSLPRRARVPSCTWFCYAAARRKFIPSNNGSGHSRSRRAVSPYNSDRSHVTPLHSSSYYSTDLKRGRFCHTILRSRLKGERNLVLSPLCLHPLLCPVLILFLVQQ